MRVFRSLDITSRHDLLILFTTGLLFWASLASLLPTLPLYLQFIGASRHQIGLIMGAFAVGLLLFRPWVGRLADRTDSQHGRFVRRKQVLMMGLVAATVAPLGYLLTQSMPLLALIRVFHGLSIAAFTTAYSALVVDISPQEQRGELIGYMSLVNPIGVAIGPALGGFCLDWAGYRPLFLMASGLGLIALLAVWRLRFASHSGPSVEQYATSIQQPFWQLLLSPRLRTPTVVMLLIGLAFGTLSTFVPLFIQSTRIPFNAGLFYTTAAISSFAVRLLVGRASDRYGRGNFITLGILFYTAAMLFLWQAYQAQTFLLAGILEGIGAGTFIPMTIALLADRSAAQERGQVFSLGMAGFDLGIGLAGPILGYVADAVGYRGLFGIATGLCLLALVIFTTQINKTLARSLRFAFGSSEDDYASLSKMA